MKRRSHLRDPLLDLDWAVSAESCCCRYRNRLDARQPVLEHTANSQKASS